MQKLFNIGLGKREPLNCFGKPQVAKHLSRMILQRLIKVLL